MYEVSSADQLAAILQFAFSPHLQSVIAIDGKDGVGKSTLSAQLCQEIGGTVISVDDHVEKGRGTYFPASHLSDVRSALFQAAAPRIVEGVCLRDVLEAIDCSSAVHVYVRRVIANGFWPDRVICDPAEPVEDIIAREVPNLRQFAQCKAEMSGEEPPQLDSIWLTPLREEIIRYHARVRPFRTADIVVSLAE